MLYEAFPNRSVHIDLQPLDVGRAFSIDRPQNPDEDHFRRRLSVTSDDKWMFGTLIIRMPLDRTTAYPDSSSGGSTPPVPRVPRSRPSRCSFRALVETRSLVTILNRQSNVLSSVRTARDAAEDGRAALTKMSKIDGLSSHEIHALRAPRPCGLREKCMRPQLELLLILT
ncbi:hypothetical protein EVAR_51281_1 [Eumeta japonica]|uniref:Uncharacterized protein n=1 Tax=Eumeta variegata TaxID=151549 RepID=A0A4C1YAW5_EUMVA|nr:hypothetical protein EVAR_51281_1 [Eumeta japonica]